MAVSCTEEDPSVSGRLATAAEGLPLQVEAVRIVRVRPGHPQGLRKGESSREPDEDGEMFTLRWLSNALGYKGSPLVLSYRADW